MAFWPNTIARTVHLPQINLVRGLVLAGRNSQDGISQQQEASTLLIPQLKKLPEAFHVRGEDASNLPTIPLQKRFTRQILKHLQPFKDLQETFATVPCSFACARSSALYLLKRTQYCVRR
jgi:hypothetical protein